MNNEEAIKRMKECIENGDTEMAHAHADCILCAVLEAHGYTELVDLYHQVDKWFA